MPAILKYGTGRRESFVDKKGILRERADFLIMKVGENISVYPAVEEYDHFIYQNLLPVSEEELITKYHGKLPKSLVGPNAVCSCGSEAVIMLDGPYANKVICKMVAQTGYHTTGHDTKNRQNAKFNPKVDLLGDSDILKTMKTQEQIRDESASEH